MQLENINISDSFSLSFAFICIQLTNCSILYAFFPFYLYSASMLPPFNSYPEMSVVCFFNTVLYVYDLLLNKDCSINIKSMLHICLYFLDSICCCYCCFTIVKPSLLKMYIKRWFTKGILKQNKSNEQTKQMNYWQIRKKKTYSLHINRIYPNPKAN